MRRRSARTSPLAIRPARAIALLLACAACVQDDGSRFNPLDVVIPNVTEDDERELGMEFDRELQRILPVINDPVVTDFINALGQAIVRQIEPQPFVYRFRVIDAPTLNAFAVPGGYVYFHSETITRVTSIDELAGVMGHEIAHIKKHHYARMRKQSQIPDLLVALAGMAAAIATEEPGLLVATQAANVAMQLRYAREYEAEADRFGSVFMVRAGYDPKGTARFFERILDEEKRDPHSLPPYLYSHPNVAERIEAVEIAAPALRSSIAADPELARALPIVQARLAQLKQAGRTSLPINPPSSDRAVAPADLGPAVARAEAGDVAGALSLLAAAEAAHPGEPRIPFQTAELLFAAGRFEEAAAAYDRTSRLDSSRAMVFYRMGLAYKEIGDRPSAVYAFEQAANRTGAGSNLRERADWETFKLTFTIVLEAGFADGKRHGETPVGAAREEFEGPVTRMAWWARLNPRFAHWAEALSLRWTAPDGRVVQEEEVDEAANGLVTSTLALDADAAPGPWSAELLVRGESVDRRSIDVSSP